LFAPATGQSPIKVGRNDPCPRQQLLGGARLALCGGVQDLVTLAMIP
jgi:hypothetical protein